MRLMRLLAAVAAVALVLPALAAPAAATESRQARAGHGRSQAAPVRAADAYPYKVVVDSFEWWFNGTTFSVVGDVRNYTDLPVQSIKVRTAAYAADDSLVAEGSDYLMFARLDPGEYGTFEVDARLSGTINRVEVWVDDWDFSSVVANHYFSASGTFVTVDAYTSRVEGSVKNLNTVDARDLRVVATMYDPDFNVVGAGYVDLFGTLTKGGSTTFSMDVSHLRLTYTPTVYVEAESDSDAEQIVTFEVFPNSLTYGAQTTVSGRTTPGSDIRMQYYDQPTAEWVDVRGDIIAAQPDGSYSLTLTPAIGSTYRTRSGENVSVPVIIYVLDKVTFKASTKKTTVGKKVVLSGTAQPADAGSKAQVQQKVGSTWKTIATVPISASGAFKYTWTPKKKGTYVLRAYVGGQSLVFPGSSSSVTIAVK